MAHNSFSLTEKPGFATLTQTIREDAMLFRPARSSMLFQPRLVIFGCLMLAALAVTSGSAQAVTVRIGGPASLLYLPYYVALDEGFLKKRGVEVDNIENVNSVASLIAGEIDFSTGGSDQNVLSAVRGKPTPAIAMMQQVNSLSISASTSLQLPNLQKGYPENLRDLKGKTVALPNRGTGAESLVRQAFSAIGFEESRDYSLVVVGSGANIIASLKGNKVDAALLWPPYADQVWADKTAVPLVREGFNEGPETRRKGAGIPFSVNIDYLKAHPDTVKLVVDAIVEGDEFVRNYDANKERLIDIAMKYTGIKDRALLGSAIASVAKLAYPGINCDAWAQVAKGLIAIKTIDKVPACADVAALSVAPREPLGPTR